jgi:hypothetical protein
MRNIFCDFTRTRTEQQKFVWFKNFIAGLELHDATHRKETGEDVDSLLMFRVAFNNLFAP